MNIYKAYTYLIGWSHQDKYYYGVRYANQTNPQDDFWKKYFTSSTYVAECREKFGDPDIIQIRKTFDSPDDATAWETKVLQRINAVDRNDFLNKQCGKYWIMDDEVKQKMSESAKKRGYNPDQLANARKYITYTQDRADKISKANKGRTITWGDKISKSHDKRWKTCEVCDKHVKEITYHRWHGKNCKSLLDT